MNICIYIYIIYTYPYIGAQDPTYEGLWPPKDLKKYLGTLGQNHTAFLFEASPSKAAAKKKSNQPHAVVFQGSLCNFVPGVNIRGARTSDATVSGIWPTRRRLHRRLAGASEPIDQRGRELLQAEGVASSGRVPCLLSRGSVDFLLLLFFFWGGGVFLGIVWRLLLF